MTHPIHQVFFLRAQHLHGTFTLVQKAATSFVWVTREELLDYLEPKEGAYMQKLLHYY